MKKLSLIGFLFIAVILASCSENKKEVKPETKPAAVEKETETSSLNWITNVEDAVKMAKAEDKTVLVDFTGSDWCKWCIKLDGEVFSQPEFASFAKDNLVLVKLDFPRSIPQSEDIQNYNRAQAQKYKIQGYPTVILLNSNGEIIGNTGYQEGGAENYVEHLKSFI